VNGKDIKEHFLKGRHKNFVDLEPRGYLRRNDKRGKLASLWPGNAADDALLVDQG
jgi:hypothetical protein